MAVCAVAVCAVAGLRGGRSARWQVCAVAGLRGDGTGWAGGFVAGRADWLRRLETVLQPAAGDHGLRGAIALWQRFHAAASIVCASGCDHEMDTLIIVRFGFLRTASRTRGCCQLASVAIEPGNIKIRDDESKIETNLAKALSRRTLTIRDAEYKNSARTSEFLPSDAAGRRQRGGRKTGQRTESGNAAADFRNDTSGPVPAADLRLPAICEPTVPARRNRHPFGDRQRRFRFPGSGDGLPGTRRRTLQASLDLGYHRLSPDSCDPYLRPLASLHAASGRQIARMRSWRTEIRTRFGMLRSVSERVAMGTAARLWRCADGHSSAGRGGRWGTAGDCDGRFQRVIWRSRLAGGSVVSAVSLIGQRYLIDISGPHR